MKSESVFSLAMASQPFLHPLSDSHHLARDSLEPVKNSPGGSIIVRRTFFFDILHAFPTKPFEDPSFFWSQHISWVDSSQRLLCCLKIGLSSQSLEVASVNKMYICWHALSYNLTWPEANNKVSYRAVALVKGFWLRLTSPRANWQQMVLVHINYGRGDCLVLIHWKSTNEWFIKVKRGPVFKVIDRIKTKTNGDSQAKAGFWSLWLLFVD